LDMSLVARDVGGNHNHPGYIGGQIEERGMSNPKVHQADMAVGGQSSA